MDPPWSVRVQDEAPLSLLAMVRGHAWVVPDPPGETVRLGAGDVAITRGPDPRTFADDPATPPQVVIHPGERCATPNGQDLAQAMDLGVRTAFKRVRGISPRQHRLEAAPPSEAGARAARLRKRQEGEARRAESAPVRAGSLRRWRNESDL